MVDKLAKRRRAEADAIKGKGVSSSRQMVSDVDLFRIAGITHKREERI